MSTTERPNFFILLGLDPDAPWSQTEFEVRLRDKRTHWTRQSDSPNKDVKNAARRNLGLVRQIEEVMMDAAKRFEEGEKARYQLTSRRGRSVRDAMLNGITRYKEADEAHGQLADIKAARLAELDSAIEFYQSGGYVTREAFGQLAKEYADIISERDLATRIGGKQPLDYLLEELERLCQPEGRINTQQAERFLREAHDTGIPLLDAIAALTKLINDKKWPQILLKEPAAAVQRLHACSVCHHLNDPTDQFCKWCGEPLWLDCPNCGAKHVDANTLACGTCGFPLMRRPWVIWALDETDRLLKKSDWATAAEQLDEARREWVPRHPDDLVRRMNALDETIQRGRLETQPAQLRIFVSHSHQDALFCQELVSALRAAGANVWYDEHDMGSGELGPTIERELLQRQVFIVILSPAALQSRWVEKETRWAHSLYEDDRTRTIQPVLATSVDKHAIWLFLRDFKRIELPGGQPYPKAEAIGRVVAAMQATA